MRDNRQIPISLKIIAAVYILNGIRGVVNYSLMLTAGEGSGIGVIIDVVNIFAGIGLLQLNPGWRKYCLVICWIAVISLIASMMIIAKAAADSPHSDPSPYFLLLIGFVGFYVWQYLVLMSPSIRSLFRN